MLSTSNIVISLFQKHSNSRFIVEKELFADAIANVNSNQRAIPLDSAIAEKDNSINLIIFTRNTISLLCCFSG